MVLPVGEQKSLSFDVRPYPFQIYGRFQDTVIVLPDRETREERELLRQMVSLYGHACGPYGSLSVQRAGEFSTQDDVSLILIGTYEDNPVIREVNASLQLPFAGNGEKFDGEKTLALSSAYSARIGTFQLLPSPFHEDRDVLAAAPGQEALANLAAFLQKLENRAKLTKDTVLIDEDQSMKAYELLSDTSRNARPDLRERLEKNKEPAIYALAATSAMLLFLLAVIIIFIRIRMHRKE